MKKQNDIVNLSKFNSVSMPNLYKSEELDLIRIGVEFFTLYVLNIEIIFLDISN